jgi:hypothetical protein
MNDKGHDQQDVKPGPVDLYDVRCGHQGAGLHTLPLLIPPPAGTADGGHCKMTVKDGKRTDAASRHQHAAVVHEALME